MADIVKMTVEGDEKFDRLADSFEKSLKKASSESTRILYTTAQSTIRGEELVASRDLLESITASSMVSSTDFVISLGSKQDYAENVEKGRRPGGKRPPISAILRWMIYKGLDNTLKAAYAIATKIARDGIKPTRVFEKTMQEATPKILDSVNENIEEGLRRGNDG